MLTDTITPAVLGVPSPQSMVAVKSATHEEPRGGRGLASVNGATGPLKMVGEKTGIGKIVGSSWVTVGCAVAVRAASAMMAEPTKLVVEPPSSVMSTVN